MTCQGCGDRVCTCTPDSRREVAIKMLNNWRLEKNAAEVVQRMNEDGRPGVNTLQYTAQVLAYESDRMLEEILELMGVDPETIYVDSPAAMLELAGSIEPAGSFDAGEFSNQRKDVDDGDYIAEDVRKRDDFPLNPES